MIFCIKLGDNLGQKRTEAKFFKNISNFLKSGSGKNEVFRNLLKSSSKFLLLFCQNVARNSVFQPVKSVCEK